MYGLVILFPAKFEGYIVFGHPGVERGVCVVNSTRPVPVLTAGELFFPVFVARDGFRPLGRE